MSAESITSGPHKDFTADAPRRNRVPGAEKIKTGHTLEVIYPIEGQPKKAEGVKRPQEHLPPTTGRDAPPAGDVCPVGQHINQVIPGDQLGDVRGDAAGDDEHMRILRARTTGQPTFISAAPDSLTFLDPDPYDPPASAGDTLGGADSRELSNSIGRPGAGMSSTEMHHDGRAHRKRPMQGTDVYGSGEIPRET
ncbi:hypothetical protein CERSUDRAFT_125354 [Gelatoporia subvermispora B]|uniref:Uncharacterized protein n=1 Tax=Ceriporiopsis subvermispora (strain B) TaxID=914234 RepID=M2R7Z7_CERS8|nr:hypothetical protein CERSUDRAFT_125354 [Gelatoporia subvermispora B]